MPNPGAFQGSRKEFLASKKMEFANSVSLGYTGEQLVTIQREYFKRYPIDLPHDEEPSPEHLAAVDDDAADPEINEPDEKTMSPEEYQAAMKTINERRVLIAKRKAQIKRWLIYQYMKESDGDPRDQRAFSPYHIFLANVRGTVSDKPRRKSPVNVWRKFHRERIERVAKLTAERQKTPKSGMASLRDSIARTMFAELTLEEQKDWYDTSVRDHELAIEEWDKKRKRPISTEPEERQRAIQSLVRFVQPVLNVIADATGWKVSLFAGGPEPAQEGMLNVISVHSGTTSGDIKQTFGQSERGAIKKDFIPIFGAFLQKCYTPEECRARALSGMEGFVPLSDMELEGTDAIIHPLPANPSPNLAKEKATRPSTTDTPPSPTSPPVVAQPKSSSTRDTPPAVISAPVTPNTQPPAISPPVVAQPASSSASMQTNIPSESTVTAATTSPAAAAREDDDVDEDTLLPVVYRLSPDPPASPVHLPASPVLSRQASVAPSRPASPSNEANEGALPSCAPTPSVHLSPAVPSAPTPILAAPGLPEPSPTTPPVPTALATPAPAMSPSSDQPADRPPPAQGPTQPSKTKRSKGSAKVSPTASPSSDQPADVPPPARRQTQPSKPKGTKGTTKEKAKAGVVDSLVTNENHRPRRELKKTEKALCIEEDMLKKNGRGTKHSREVVEDQTPSEPTSKRLRGASKKNASRR